jgi:hypothetical protein
VVSTLRIFWDAVSRKKYLENIICISFKPQSRGNSFKASHERRNRVYSIRTVRNSPPEKRRTEIKHTKLGFGARLIILILLLFLIILLLYYSLLLFFTILFYYSFEHKPRYVYWTVPP